LVHCPHFNCAVFAVRNRAIDRLVSCTRSEECRKDVEPQPGEPAASRTFPRGCPVYPLQTGAS
jgi:hypothetical protein